MPEGARWARALAAVLAAIVLLRVAVMLASGAGLHVDEAQYWDWSRHLAWGYWSKPPGVAALIAVSTLLAGDGVLGVRLLAMVAWGLTAAVLGALAWDMAGRGEAGRRAGWWSALLLAGTAVSELLLVVPIFTGGLPFGWSLPLPLLVASAALVAGVALLRPGAPDLRKA